MSRQRSPATKQTKHTRWVIHTSASLSSVLAFCALGIGLAKPNALNIILSLRNLQLPPQDWDKNKNELGKMMFRAAGSVEK